MDIHFRPFLNTDPPALVRVWNEALTGRGAAFLQGTLPLEMHVLSKPYFDPEGLIVGLVDGEPIGFAHAGFGPDAAGTRLTFTQGVVCAVLVRPNFRGRGVGTRLLHAAEEYLRRRGAREIVFGANRSLNPFYMGIYGGSELPGVLGSDAAAEPFLVHSGYRTTERISVLHRGLEKPISTADARFSAIRKDFEVQIGPRPIGTRWFDAGVLAHLEMLAFVLREKSTGNAAAQVCVWDMDLFGWRWHQPSAGIMDLKVDEAYRRRGLGKFLIAQALQYLQDQFFTLAEAQAPETNSAARGLYLGLGFQTVDEGRVYRLRDRA